MKTALQILNEVEPNGELLSTELALRAMEIYANSKYDYSKECKCGEASTGSTWCCNVCGLPIDKQLSWTQAAFLVDLDSILSDTQWMWDNLDKPHTADHFNIPANNIEAIKRVIENIKNHIPDAKKKVESVDIELNGLLKARIAIKDGEIDVIAAMDGGGEPIALRKINITTVTK